MKVKYFATYHGPSYGSYGMEVADGFRSLAEAKQSMRDRQIGVDYSTEYRVNADGAFVLWATDQRTNFPCTTSADYMDLYEAYHQGDGTYSYSEEIAYRLTIGERGGIVVER